MTPHISAKKDEIASVVLMPGDSLRAKFIAENYLENYKCVNEVRGMLAFTGYYKGKRVTVMGHGMGIPSIGIYTYELFHFYDVQAIIRIGSCGSYVPNTELGQIIVGSKALSLSTYAQCIGVEVKNNTLCADEELKKITLETANELSINVIEGTVLSSDCFYSDNQKYNNWIKDNVQNNNLLAVEMEAFGLYANAKKLNKKALCLVSVSDSIIEANKSLSSDERVTFFRNMMLLALEIVCKII